jgi:hypothetical protein
LKRGEWDAAACVEANALPLEKASLELSVLRAGGDGTLGIYHALPRDGRARVQRMESVTDQARLPWQAGNTRHLSVSSYAAARYPRHYVVDAPM